MNAKSQNPKPLKDKELFRKANIEVTAVCRKCGEHWGTLEGNIKITMCDNCKTGKYINHACDYYDVRDFLKKYMKVLK